MHLCIVRVLLTEFQQVIVKANLPGFRSGFQCPHNVSRNALEFKVRASIVPHRRRRTGADFTRLRRT